MKSSKNEKVKSDFIEKFYVKQQDEISFIDIKKGAEIKIRDKKYIADSEFPIPIRKKFLVKDIKNQSNYDGLEIKNIVDGIIYVLGTSKEFKYKNKYLDILNSLNIELEPYVIYNINSFEDDLLSDSLVYATALINNEENVKTCFVYASVLENVYYSLQESSEEDENSPNTIFIFNEMLKYYEKCIDFDDKFALAYYKLGYIYKQCGQYIRAKLYWENEQIFDDDVLRVDEIRENLEDIEVLVVFETGKNLILEGRSTMGIDKLLPMVEKYSNWWDLMFFIGLGYRQLEEYKIAFKYFELALKIRNEDRVTLNEIGICHLNLGEYEEAKDVFTNLLSLDSNNCDILCNRAVTKHQLYDDDGARNDIRLALKIKPDDEVALTLKKYLEEI